MKKIRSLWAMTVALAGCALQQAPRPKAAEHFDPGARARAYEDYKLVYESSVWVPKWKRADGEYIFGRLDDVLDAYPQTRALKQRTRTRATVIGSLAGVAGGVAGFTLGYNLSVPESQRMSSGAQAALYATSGGLLVGAIVLGLLWPNPIDEIADTYNDSLRRDLLGAGPTALRGLLLAPSLVTDGERAAPGLAAVGRF
jgi:hypothetical protein